MTPASLPGIASISFSVPASQGGSQPPFAVLLGSASGCISTGKTPGSFVAAFSRLPRIWPLADHRGCAWFGYVAVREGVMI